MTVRRLALALWLFAGVAAAQDPEEEALELADRTIVEPAQPSDWRIFAEGALFAARPRGDSVVHGQRLSLDAAYDKRLAPAWRLTFADRVDLAWRGAPAYDDAVNTLKELYLTWQPRSGRILDFGRVNLRHGAALGYNPTDFFRAGAARSIVSVDPAVIRRDRLGTVMLRGQALWPGGSATALYAPELADRPNDSPFSPDFGATNNENRWLIAVSQRLTETFNPQWLLYDEEDAAPQLGVNLSTLLNQATVGYLEWSGGRSRSLISQALGLPDDTTFRSRAAAGFTYTAPTRLSVTLEYAYNGAGLSEDDWDALRAGPPQALQRYRRFVDFRQDPPTKRNWLLLARWEDLLLVNLDVTTIQRISVADESRLSFLEARYHWERVDLALQYQRNHGDATSEFGALPAREVWQVVATYFF